MSHPTQEFSQDVLDQWNKNLAGHTAGSNRQLWRLHGLLYNLKGRIDKLSAVYSAVDAFANASSTDTPGESLRKFRRMYDALRSVVPYIPGFYEFLSAYSTILGSVADQLDQIASDIYRHERDVAVLHPGVWPGGWTLYSYVTELLRASAPLSLEDEDDVIEWVKDHRFMLTLTTGEEPPARTETFLGFDILKPDFVDRPALEDWFFEHRENIRLLIYGNASF